MMKDNGIKQIKLSDILSSNDLFNPDFTEGMFEYTEDEVKDFHEGFDKLGVPIGELYESVSESFKLLPKANKIGNIIELMRALDPADIDRFEEYLEDFRSSNPNMLWNMLHEDDRKLYKDEFKFHDWFSTLSEDKIDYDVLKAADGQRLHNDTMYTNNISTRVEIIDGYLAISSSNLDILDRFLKRTLLSNDYEYEHRIKKHGEVTIHSYVFNMNK